MWNQKSKQAQATSTNPQEKFSQHSEKMKPRGTAIVEALIIIPPDGGWGWVVVVAAFICNFTADGTMYTFGIFLDEISVSIGCTNTEMALANSLMTGFYYLSGPVISALTNRYGFRVVGVIGGLLSCASILATSFATTLVTILLLYGVIGGVGFGMLYVPSIVVIGFYFERWRALSTSIAVCGSSLGMICFPPVFTTLLKNHDWRFKFRVLSCACFGCAFCSIAYRPLEPVAFVAVDETNLLIRKDDDRFGSKHGFSRYRNFEYPRSADIQGKSTVVADPRMRSNVSLVGLEGPSTSTPKPGAGIRLKERLKTVYEEGQDGKKWKRFRACFCYLCKRRKIPTRPFYRDDIFYTGSVMQLPEHIKSIQSSLINFPLYEAPIDYHLSVTRIMTQKDMQEDDRCICCPEAVKRTLATMLDFSLLKSPSFLILSISGFFTLLGLYSPFLYISERAKLHGIKSETAYLLISVLGISNTIGRIGSGILSSLPNLNALLCSYVSLTICGIATMVSSLSFHEYWQIGFACIYGATVSVVAALRPIILVEMLGLEKLTNAFGLSLLFQGIACLIGIPLIGLLRDLTGDFELSFYFIGSVILISTVLLMFVKPIMDWEQKKKGART